MYKEDLLNARTGLHPSISLILYSCVKRALLNFLRKYADSEDKVVDIAAKHGVVSLLNPMDFETLDVKMKVIGNILMAEKSYVKQWKCASELAERFAKNGVRTFVLKGFTFAQYWEIPHFRPSSDIDCFLVMHEGSNHSDAYHMGNKLAASLGIYVDYEVSKHSVFTYKDIIVENHEFCVPIRGDKKAKKLERYLENCMLCSSPQYIGDSKLECPSVMFNALFLIKHAQRHFLDEGLALRHICDWAMLMKLVRKELDIVEFERVCKEAGMWRFVEAISRLAYYIFGIAGLEFDSMELRPQDKRMLSNIMSSKIKPLNTGTLWHQRMIQIFEAISNGWKYHYFGSESMPVHLLKLACGHVWDKSPKV